MFAYFIRRLVSLVPTLVFVSMLIFGLQQLLPGDPAVVLAGEERDPAVVAFLRAKMHLDDPLPVQYAHWVGGVLRGDLARITLGPRVNLQDGCLVHTDFECPLVVEEGVVVGHGAILRQLGQRFGGLRQGPRGLAQRGAQRHARAGQLANFTGIDSPYEPPENPEIRVDTSAMTASVWMITRPRM